MGRKGTTLLARGGGDITGSRDLVEEFTAQVERSKKAILILTIATSYKFVNAVDVSDREESYSEPSVKKVEEADAMFFTGGDQLNITTMIGGTPIQTAIENRVKDGGFISGTSAGAAMMSQWMITSGKSDGAPRVGAVEIAPGMGLVRDTVIDTHFSQRGRHGRLLTAVAHYPQAIGIGLDESTGISIRGTEFRVVGSGVVTVRMATTSEKTTFRIKSRTR